MAKDMCYEITCHEVTTTGHPTMGRAQVLRHTCGEDLGHRGNHICGVCDHMWRNEDPSKQFLEWPEDINAKKAEEDD